MKKILLLCAILLFSPLYSDSKPESVKNFSFLDLSGKLHNFDEYKGKWVLVNYWATYCPPCRAEMPDIERFYQDNKNKFTVLGMDAGGSEKAEIASFQKEFGISYPLIPAQESTMLAFGIVMGIPTSYIISPKGEIIDKYVGIITYDDLDFLVNSPASKKAVSQK